MNRKTFSLTTTGATPATGIAHLTKSPADTEVQFAIGGTYGTVTFHARATDGSVDGSGNLLYFPVPVYDHASSTVLTSSAASPIAPADNATLLYSVRAAGFTAVELYLDAIASGAALVSGQSFSVVGSPYFTVTGGATVGGGLLSSSPTGGVGYATGAGGTVAQGTNRTTGVTLNKTSGTITLFSAAGSATPATFTVTNTAVAATDTPVITQKSGTDAYQATVSAVAAGSFKVTIIDLTGTTTEAPAFNMNIIKGVAA